MVARLRDAVQRGTNAARPAATAVDVGTLYYDTTNSSLGRSTGAAWESVEGAGGLADQGTITYLDASEAAAPATPAANKVRLYAKADGLLYSKDDAGVETVVTGGAGSGGAAVYAFPLDVPPASPHSKDDEFPSTSLDVKWTNPITSTRTNTLAVANGWVTFEPSESGTASTGFRGAWGVRQTSPTGSFTITARIAHGPGVTADDGRAGIFVARTATTKAHVLGSVATGTTHVEAIGTSLYSESADWGAYDGAFSLGENAAIGYNTIGAMSGIWLRIKWDSGTSILTFDYSTNGVFWRNLTTRSGQAQPDRMGICIYNNSTVTYADHALGADWFRVTEP